jgi:hypothetical protein
MELLLALAVITAVIIFGALISLGNERQRRAIEELREQVILWAIQDLRIKREHLAREVRVDDPMGWLNRIAAKACGYDLKLQVVETFNEPQALVCESIKKPDKIIFSPLSLAEIRILKRGQRGRLSQIANQNPLFSLAGNSKAYELTVLNSGFLFDLELSLAWKSLTSQILEKGSLWMYFVE